MKKNTNPYANKYGKDVIQRPKYQSPLIKWYQTPMTYEQKYRLGLLTLEEYEEWQRQLAEEEKAASQPSTFWGNDDGDRENLASDAYNDFLNANNIDISNNNSVDIDSLLGEYGEASPIVHLTEEEILANVEKDIHGGSVMLTEEEIAALFAAANGEG